MGSSKPAMIKLQVCACLVASVSAFPFPRPDGPGPLPIPRPGQDGTYAAGDGHFQYINVPAHKVFEWGYRRGNPDHNREEYLSQKDHTFKAKVKYNLHPELLNIPSKITAEVVGCLWRAWGALLRLQPR